MINKTIHYVWLGAKNMPATYALSRDSVIKYASDFEIILWTEEELSGFELPIYFYKLMNEKKYALASDIYRMHILNRYGGIYMDTDQVLVKCIDDLLDCDMFISKYHEVHDYYGFGLVGVQPGHVFCGQMINYYNQIELDKYVIINKIGSEIINNILQQDKNKIRILEQEYFYPLTNKDFTNNTRSYHLANTSWIPMYKKVLYKVPFYNNIKVIMKKHLPHSIKKRIFKIEYL